MTSVPAPPGQLSIYAVICVFGCFAMFSAMIVSNILGNMSLTVMFALLSGLFLLGLVITCMVLSISAEMDQKLQELARLACCRLESKICKHWKILLLMACLRKAGVFDTYSMLDEIIWTGYAAFVDD